MKKQENIFEYLKKDFERVLETTENKKFLIEREISALKRFIYEDPKPEGALKIHIYKFKSVFDPSEIGSIHFKTVREIFDHLLLDNGSENFINEEVYQQETVKYTKQLLDYFQYLNILLSNNLKGSTIEKTKLSHKQKLLALYYLGLDLKEFENSKAAKALSAILDLSEDNTRQYLSYVPAGKNNVRTSKNLEVVSRLFRNSGLADISHEIEKDIKKLVN